jgi:hypothetical protein
MSDMTALWFVLVLALVFAAVWIYLGRNPKPRAKIGPDGTNVRDPESFVVHHEGKGQGLDIANTALKKRTEELRRDLPGDADKIKAPVPGRDMVRMDAPPSDVSKFGDGKVAPGAEPKEKVLMEGPPGSRPETPEEPGSPYAKGRRVTDTHRDMELAADLLPDVYPGRTRHRDRNLSASPSTNGQEPGYGLGKTAYNSTDGEGGFGDPDLANYTEDRRRPERGRVLPFRSRTGEGSALQDHEVELPGDEVDLPDNEPHHWGADFHTAWGEDQTVALVRNPRSLYVYWERAGHGDENLSAIVTEAEWKQAEPCLRVYDLTSGARPGQTGGHTFDLVVSELDDHYFINSGIEPGREYVVAYGRLLADRQFYPISQSDPVATPPDRPAPETEASMLYKLYGYKSGSSAQHYSSPR